MGITYFKRFRMELPLRGIHWTTDSLPSGYELVPWHDSLLDAHADVKFRSFRNELDSKVFPCLGDPDGCRRLMQDIARKEGFLPAATWLLMHRTPYIGKVDYCGTVQGIITQNHFGPIIGCIQNLGITEEHRGRGLGTRLLLQALVGFQRAGVGVASLEVTAENTGALQLYRGLGFRRVRTVYKASEVAYS